MEQNQKIQPGRDVLYVVKVVTQFLQIVFMRRAVPASDLSPAGNPRLDRRALTVERDFPGPSAFLGNDKGARTDEAHVSAKYVEKLRQFIKPVPAEPATHARGAVVVLLCRALGIRVKMHRPKLEQREDPAVFTHALLAVNRWPAGIKTNRNREQGHDGQSNQDTELGRSLPVRVASAMAPWIASLMRIWLTPTGVCTTNVGIPVSWQIGPSSSTAISTLDRMMSSACEDCVAGVSWLAASDMAARTSGGRLVDVWVISSSRLAARNSIVGL